MLSIIFVFLVRAKVHIFVERSKTMRQVLIISLLQITCVATGLNMFITFYDMPAPYSAPAKIVKDVLLINFIDGPAKKTYSKPQIPDHIVLHSTGNSKPSANAQFHAKYMLRSKKKTSWHFTVDDCEVIQHYPITTVTWGAGGCNTGAIHIEVCQYKGMDVEAAIKNLRLLLKTLPDLPLVSHKSCTGKDCPSLPEVWSFL